VTESQKTEKIFKSIFYINLHLKDDLGMEFTACYKASWCQKERWYHLPIWGISLFL